jgi:hypothetical protein
MKPERRRFPRPSLVMLPNGFTLGEPVLRHLRDRLGLARSACAGGMVHRARRLLRCHRRSHRARHEHRECLRRRTRLPGGRDLVRLRPGVDDVLRRLAALGMGLDPRFHLRRLRRDAARALQHRAAGEAKKAAYFKGLPSPAAGGTLATYYWFSQTPLYNEFFVDWPWETIMRYLMLTLSALHDDPNVPYPAWPKFSFRTLHGILGITVLFSSMATRCSSCRGSSSSRWAWCT